MQLEFRYISCDDHFWERNESEMKSQMKQNYKWNKITSEMKTAVSTPLITLFSFVSDCKQWSSQSSEHHQGREGLRDVRFESTYTQSKEYFSICTSSHPFSPLSHRLSPLSHPFKWSRRKTSFLLLCCCILHSLPKDVIHCFSFTRGSEEDWVHSGISFL